MYHFLKLDFHKHELNMKLEFTKIELLKKCSLRTRVYGTPCNIKFIASVSNSFATFFTTFSQLLTYLSSHVTLTKERKK